MNHKYEYTDMKSLTIHMDDILDQRIREKAAAEGQSLNKTITGVLKQALGMRSTSRRADFLDQFGVWNAQERVEFDDLTRCEIDPEDWQ